MYCDYFGLKQPPFRITPDTSLFFPGGNRGAILNALIYAITSGEGIVKVVGEVGSGKTMLCRMLSVELPDNVEVVYLANPSLSPDNILHAIAFELKLPVTAQDDRLRVMHSLQEYLLERHAGNRQVVVFVEEAQSMPLATLEEIRLLSNLETKQHKLLQIVLFGQPELDQMISRREIRQLKERITYSFNLNPLKTHEARDYLNTRLRACGCRAGDVFNNAAVRAITRYSRGLLRRINILADKALLSAYARNSHKVTAHDVTVAARDSEFVAGWLRFRYSATLIGLIALLGLAGFFLPVGEIIDRLMGDDSVAQAGQDNALQKKPQEPGSDSSQLATAHEDNVATLYLPQDDTPYYEFSRSAAVWKQEAPEKSHPQVSSGQSSSPAGDGHADNAVAVSAADENKTTAQTEDLAEYLLDQVHYARVEVGELSLTREETELLLRHLKSFPPEAVLDSGNGVECKLCTAIIYRPLVNMENL